MSHTSKNSSKSPSKSQRLAAEALKLSEAAQCAAEAELERQKILDQKAAAEEAKQRAELLSRMRLESARLACEDEFESEFHSSREISLKSLDEQLDADRDWKTYLNCNPLPDVRDEAALSAYIELWIQSHNYGALAAASGSGSDSASGGHQPIHTYYDRLIGSCSLTERLVSDLLDLSGEAREEFDFPRQEWCDAMIRRLREISHSKLDYLTAQFLTRADEYEDAESKSMQQSCFTEEIQFGLWVHTSAKHGRIKKIDFEALQFFVELPVALQKSRTSIRIIKTAFDSTAQRFDHRYSTQQPSFPLLLSSPVPPLHFTSIGGLISIDQCVLPPAPKKAKGWLIREITPLAKTVQLIPYPAQTSNNNQQIPISSPANNSASADQNSSFGPASALDDPSAPSTTQAPLRVSFTLPRHLFLDDRDPHFGWFDSRHSCWRQEGIQLTSFDPISGKVSLNLALLKPFAVIQPRALDFPYREWHLAPTQLNSANSTSLPATQRLILVGSRFPVEFEIRPTEARLAHPTSEVLKNFNERFHRPGHLLPALARLGLNLHPSLDDAAYCRKPIKDSPFSYSLHDQISFLSTAAFQVSHSQFSSARGPQQALFKVRIDREQFKAVWARVGASKRVVYDKAMKQQSDERRRAIEAAERVKNEEENKRKQTEGNSDEEETNANSGSATEPETAKLDAEEANAEPVEQTISTNPINSIPPAMLKSQRHSRSQDWIVIFAQQLNTPTSAQIAEFADSNNSSAAEAESDSDPIPRDSPLITFSAVRGLDLSGLVDLTPADSSSSHIALRRAVYSYLKLLYSDEFKDELINLGLLMDLYEDLDGEFKYLSATSETLLMQQTVKRILNLTQPFTFH